MQLELQCSLGYDAVPTVSATANAVWLMVQLVLQCSCACCECNCYLADVAAVPAVIAAGASVQLVL